MSIHIIDLAVATIPIIILIWTIVKRRGLPVSIALPIASVVVYILQIIYFKTNSNILHAAVLDGLLTALTPFSIIGGAILLFKTMEISGSLSIMRGWLNQITTNKVGQLMIVGWSFSFLIEGISGFGTPAALAAPLLAGLGFPVVSVAIYCLIMNTVPVSFGAVGMPTWFGFGQLGLSSGDLLILGFKTALIHAAAALIIPLLALRIVVSWQEIYKNIIFIYLSVIGSVLPYLLSAKFSVEFPSIIGGFIGLMVSILLAQRHIGLKYEGSTGSFDGPKPSKKDLVKAFFPILATVLILLISRFPYLGIKQWLSETSPSWSFNLGSLGEFQISLFLVVQLKHIFGTEIAWKHAMLYVPSLIPFVAVSLICFYLFRMSKEMIHKTWHDTWKQLSKPFIALLGAMVFVKLFMIGEDRSSAQIIGQSLASIAGSGWQFAAVYLGALGAFFSGSNTVSNLTFAGIQDTIARTVNLDRFTILSLQSVGGAMGCMMCIHNIVAVCTILGLQRQEGFIIRKTFWPMLVYGIIAGAVSIFI